MAITPEYTVPEHPMWRLRSVSGPPAVLTLRVDGEIDVATCAPLESELAAHVSISGSADVLLDLRGVAVLSSAGTGVLSRLADRLGERGRRLLVVLGADGPNPVLAAIAAVGVLETFPSVEAALAAL